jgi:drug/metabolite transporter (DMT)-like permease
MTLKGALLLLATVSFTVTGQILIKKGVDVAGNLTFKAAFTSTYLIIGVLCYISGFLIWLNVLKILPLSIAYPSSSISYVLVIFASAIVLGEALNLFKLIGMACILVGVIFISRA